MRPSQHPHPLPTHPPHAQTAVMASMCRPPVPWVGVSALFLAVLVLLLLPQCEAFVGGGLRPSTTTTTTTTTPALISLPAAAAPRRLVTQVRATPEQVRSPDLSQTAFPEQVGDEPVCPFMSALDKSQTSACSPPDSLFGIGGDVYRRRRRIRQALAQPCVLVLCCCCCAWLYQFMALELLRFRPG